MKRILLFIFTISILPSCREKIKISDAYGNFEATITTVSAEANGRLVFLHLEEGQSLKAGALVGIVDTTQLHLQVQQIKAGINTLPKKLRNTLADIEVLQNQKANLTRERDRVKRLVEKKAATTKQLDDLNGQIEVVEKQIAAIRATTRTANSAILAEKEPLVAQIAVLNEQIRKSYVRNLISGTVLTKLAEAHEIVRIGSPLYRIGQLDTMTLRFYVDAIQLQQLKTGQPVQVLTDKGAEGYTEWQGHISWISDKAEFTPKTIQTKKDRVNLVYAVKARVPNPDGILKIGMPAEVNFGAGRKEKHDRQ